MRNNRVFRQNLAPGAAGGRSESRIFPENWNSAPWKAAERDAKDLAKGR